jgi:hypothetical protein
MGSKGVNLSKREDKKTSFSYRELEVTRNYVVLTVKTARLIDPNGFQKITSKYPPRDLKVPVWLVHFIKVKNPWSGILVPWNRQKGIYLGQTILAHLNPRVSLARI